MNSLRGIAVTFGHVIERDTNLVDGDNLLLLFIDNVIIYQRNLLVEQELTKLITAKLL